MEAPCCFVASLARVVCLGCFGNQFDWEPIALDDGAVPFRVRTLDGVGVKEYSIQDIRNEKCVPRVKASKSSESDWKIENPESARSCIGLCLPGSNPNPPGHPVTVPGDGRIT